MGKPGAGLAGALFLPYWLHLGSQTCHRKQSPRSRVAGTLGSQENLRAMSRRLLPASKLLPWLAGKGSTDGPRGAASCIWAVRWNTERAKGLGGRKGITARKCLLTRPPPLSSSGLEEVFIWLLLQSLWSGNKGAAGKHFPKGCGKISSAQHTWKVTRIILLARWKRSEGFCRLNCAISGAPSVPLRGLGGCQCAPQLANWLRCCWPTFQEPDVFKAPHKRHPRALKVHQHMELIWNKPCAG